MNDVDLLEDPVLAGLFDELRALGDGPPPPVGDELAALFAGAVPIARNGRKAAVIALVSAAVLGGTVGTAAANSLPDPAQRFVAGVVRTLTPFDLPTPADDSKATRPTPVVPTPDDQTGPTQAPVLSHPSAHAAQPTPEHESGDDGSSSGKDGSDDSRSTGSDDSRGSSDDGSATSSGSSSSDDGATSGSSDGSGSGDSSPSGTSDGSSGGGSSDGSSDSGSSGGTSGGGSDDGSPDSIND